MFRGIVRRSLICLSAGSGSLLSGSGTSNTYNLFESHHDNDNDNAASFLSALSEENDQVLYNHANEEDMIAFHEASQDGATDASNTMNDATDGEDPALSFDEHTIIRNNSSPHANNPYLNVNGHVSKNNLNSPNDILRAALPPAQMTHLLQNTIIHNDFNSFNNQDNTTNPSVKPNKKIMTKAKRIRLAAAMQAAAAQLQAAPSPANALIHSHHVAQLRAEEELLHVSLNRLQAERELATVRHNCDVQLRRFREGIRRRDFAVREMVRAVTGSAMGSSSSSSSSSNSINSNDNNITGDSNADESTSYESSFHEDNSTTLSSGLSGQSHNNNYSNTTEHDEGITSNSNNNINKNNKVNSNIDIRKHHGSSEERFENEGGNSGHYAPPVSTSSGNNNNNNNSNSTINKSTRITRSNKGKAENQQCFELGGEAADPIGKAGEPWVHEGNTHIPSHQSNARKTHKLLNDRELQMTPSERQRARAFEVATRAKTPSEETAIHRVVTNPSAVSVSSDVHALSESASSEQTKSHSPQRRQTSKALQPRKAMYSSKQVNQSSRKASRQRQPAQSTSAQGKRRSNSRKRTSSLSSSSSSTIRRRSAATANALTSKQGSSRGNYNNRHKSRSRSTSLTRNQQHNKTAAASTTTTTRRKSPSSASSLQGKRRSSTMTNNNKNNRNNRRVTTNITSRNKSQSHSKANTLRKHIQTVQRQKMIKKAPLQHKKTTTKSKQKHQQQRRQQKKPQKRNTHKK